MESPRPLTFLAAFAAVIALSGAALGQGLTLDQEGEAYAVTYNEHGVILAPQSGAPGIVYLGIGCDVFSPSRGDGRWSALGSRVYVEFTTGETLPFDGALSDDVRALCPL